MTPPANDGRPEDHAAYVSGLVELIAELRAQNATLVARVAELERQLGSSATGPTMVTPYRCLLPTSTCESV